MVCEDVCLTSHQCTHACAMGNKTQKLLHFAQRPQDITNQTTTCCQLPTRWRLMDAIVYSRLPSSTMGAVQTALKQKKEKHNDQQSAYTWKYQPEDFVPLAPMKRGSPEEGTKVGSVGRALCLCALPRPRQVQMLSLFG